MDYDQNVQIVINMWSIFGATISASFAIYARRNYIHWFSRYYPNRVHVELYSIKKCQHTNKYLAFSRTIYHRNLSDTFSNQYGSKQLQKSLKRCKFSDPFIRIKSDIGQRFFYGGIIAQIEQDYKLCWFKRDKHLNNYNSMDNTINVYSEKYTLALWCPYHYDLTLPNINVENQSNLFTAYLKYIFRKTNNKKFVTMKNIRGFLINEKFLETVKNDIGEVRMLSDEQWTEYLDHKDIPTETGSAVYHDRILKWAVIKKIIQEYQKDPVNKQWAEPLCSIDVPIEDGEKCDRQTTYDIPSSNQIPHYYSPPLTVAESLKYHDQEIDYLNV